MLAPHDRFVNTGARKIFLLNQILGQCLEHLLKLLIRLVHVFDQRKHALCRLVVEAVLRILGFVLLYLNLVTFERVFRGD